MNAFYKKIIILLNLQLLTIENYLISLKIHKI
jgi:hypothetical protein